MKQVKQKKVIGMAIVFECACICTVIVLLSLLLNKVKIDTLSTTVIVTLCIMACIGSLIRFCMPSQKASVRAVTFLFLFFLMLLISKILVSRVFLLSFSVCYYAIATLENIIGRVLTKERTAGRINVNKVIMTSAGKSFFKPVFLRLTDIFASSLLLFFVFPFAYILIGVCVKLGRQGETLITRNHLYLFNTYRAYTEDSQNILEKSGTTLCRVITQFNIYKTALVINIWRGQLSFFHKHHS